MPRPLLAVGDERTVLSIVLDARRQGRAVVVPPGPHTGDRFDELPQGHLVAFTSGSTGGNRGVLRTHDSWTASLDPLTELMGLLPSDRICVLGSVRATMGMYGAVHAIHALGDVILADESREQATVAHAVPAAAWDLLTDPPAGLRLIVVAGDRVPTALVERADACGVRMLEYYGATELSFVAYRLPGEPSGLLPFPGVRIRIDDGVIWARSDYLAKGYVGTQDGPGRWCDGWATVQDRGSWVDGRLHVDGRGDAGVTVAGHTVHLDDVEAYLSERMRAASAAACVNAAELAVTSVPHQHLGAILVGVLTGPPFDPGVMRRIARGLPGPARPRRWIWVATLPRTAAGKVDRPALRLLVQDAQAGASR